jgi:hypothetical protein
MEHGLKTVNTAENKSVNTRRHHSKSRIYFIDQKELHHRNKKVGVKSYLIKTKSSGHFR